MKNNKRFYFFTAITIILAIISITGNMKEKRIVKVLNRYNEIDKILIIKDDNKYEIIGFDLEKYKEALEPRNIVSKKNGKGITGKIGNKIIDIEYYIENQKLLESSIYSLSDKLNDDFKSYSFEVSDKFYTMVVNKEYRGVDKMNRNFLLEYLN